MLGQSNHGLTRQPLPSLDFGDRDLTDAFVDVRDGTHSSISGFGHSRGSSPISALSSRRSTPSTALSMETSESKRALPNMSALLDFLDNDNSHPFPSRYNSSRKQKSVGSRRASGSLGSIATTPPHPNSVIPRPMVSDFDLTSHTLHTYNDHTHRFRGVLPTSSTPFTNHRNDTMPEEISVISSPLNKRHVFPSGLLPNFPSLHFSEQIPNRQACPTFPSLDHAPGNLPERHSLQSERVPGNLPLETPARIISKVPSAADRLAAAVMEGAPESHWTFRVEHDSTLSRAGIRRSKVVEELLQPMQPSISSPGKHPGHLPEISRSANDDDLPKSLIDETRRSFHVPPPPIIPPASSDSIRHSRLTKSAGCSPSPDLIRPTPQRTSTFTPIVCSQDPNGTNPSAANEQVEVLDARVNQLLSHIRSDQLEKANLVSSLAEARAEVASLRDEVRLLRIGVQKLGEGRSFQSAGARLERNRVTMMTLVGDEKEDAPPDNLLPRPSSSRCQREGLEAWLSENTLPPMSDTRKTKPIEMSPKQPDLRPSSCSNLTRHEISPVQATRRQTSAVQSTSSRKNRCDQSNNQNADLTEKFTKARSNTESSIMNDLTKQFLGDLALGLSFTRHVDQLLMNPTVSKVPSSSLEQQYKFRPDSEIFTPANLDRLVCRLKVWRQIVLGYSHPTNKSGPNTIFPN